MWYSLCTTLYNHCNYLNYINQWNPFGTAPACGHAQNEETMEHQCEWTHCSIAIRGLDWDLKVSHHLTYGTSRVHISEISLIQRYISLIVQWTTIITNLSNSLIWFCSTVMDLDDSWESLSIYENHIHNKS